MEEERQREEQQPADRNRNAIARFMAGVVGPTSMSTRPRRPPPTSSSRAGGTRGHTPARRWAQGEARPSWRRCVDAWRATAAQPVTGSDVYRPMRGPARLNPPLFLRNRDVPLVKAVGVLVNATRGFFLCVCAQRHSNACRACSSCLETLDPSAASLTALSSLGCKA